MSDYITSVLWRGNKELFKQLSFRAQNTLIYLRCLTEADVVQTFQANPRVPNCGKKTIKEIRDVFGIKEICPHCGNPLKDSGIRK